MMDLSKTGQPTYRNDVLEYAASRYGTKPEYLWLKAPEYAVLRHENNKKWYALIMNVQREKLGLSGDGEVDILELKCDPLMKGSMMMEKGILPAYHMHKGNWITVLLDGSVEKDTIFFLLDMSFDVTAIRKSQKKAQRALPKEWIVPANPNYYDLETHFAESEMIQWKQTSNVIVGDLIYLYVAAPVSAILYQCRAVEVDIPYRYDDEHLRMRRVMKLQLLHRFSEDQLTMEKLREHGVFAVRGPRGVPNSLHHAIKAFCDAE